MMWISSETHQERDAPRILQRSLRKQMKSVSEMGRRSGWKPVASMKKLVAARGFSSLLTPILGLAILPGVVACDNDYTLGWVYTPAAKTTGGLVSTFGVDNQEGFLRTLADSPVPTGGRTPVAIVAAPDQPKHPYLYVANHDDSNVVVLGIGTDGKLYPYSTYNTTGSFPVAMAISPAGNFLYVAYTFQSCSGAVEQSGATNPNCAGSFDGFSAASPGPGGISIYPINSSAGQPDSLGTPVDFPIGRSPIGIAVGANNVVYVVTQDPAATSNVTGQTGNLFAFQANATTGALTALPGETITATAGDVPSFGYPSGVLPGGVILNSTGTQLYVSDFSGNTIYGYSIAANGVPTQIGSAPTDAGPEGMAIDPTNTYLFTADYTAGTIDEFTFGANGAPVPSTTAQSTQAGTGVTCVTIEPLHGIYLYTSNSLSNNVTGEQILAGGALKQIVFSPYTSSTLPECVVAVQRVF